MNSYIVGSKKHVMEPLLGERPTQRGSALLFLLIIAVVASAALASAFTYVNRSAVLQQRSNMRLEGTYAAEYAFEKAFQQLKVLISITNRPTIEQTTAATNLTTAPTGVFRSSDGYSWKTNLTVPIENGIVVDEHSNITAAQGTYKYLTNVEFERTLASQKVQLSFQREWVYDFKPLFQYAIFYNNDMELFPGANFVVGGRVHSNGKIYTGTSAAISFKDYVTHIDGVSNSYGPLDPRAPGSPGSADNITYANNKLPVVTTREDPPGFTTANASDSNVNNDGPRELIEIPDYVQNDDNAGDRLYNKAGLKVLANTTGSAVTTASGVIVPANSRVYVTADGTQIPATDSFAVYLNAMFATGSIKDYRESSTNVITTDVDLGKLNTGYGAGGLPQTIPNGNWPNNSTVPAALKNQVISPALQGKPLWNGILYVADVTDSPSHKAGVKLVNGTHLPNGSNASSPTKGLTFVSENAAYVVGDYNTGGMAPVNSGSATANNYVDGYTSADDLGKGFTVQPAAIAADAVTVVSSDWTTKNYNGKATLTDRVPVNTTINTALISGIVPSNGSAYSGGVENYIRLLEHWSGKRLTYYGSIINLYKSERATAKWKDTGNYYNAPSRNWYFDAQFKSPNRLPPGTPTLRTVKKGQWVQLQ